MKRMIGAGLREAAWVPAAVAMAPVLAMAFALGSCTDQPARVCNSDYDCQDGQTCGTALGPPFKSSTLPGEGVCVPAPACVDDWDCSAFRICADGFCHETASSAMACDVETACPEGEVCFGGVCRTRSGSARPCDSDFDCPSGESCTGFACRDAAGSGRNCSTDRECPQRESCSGGSCGPDPNVGSDRLCRDTFDCPAGETCVCPDGGESCEQGNCRNEEGGGGDGGQRCADDLECPPGQRCLARVCRDAPGSGRECNSDVECPSGERCLFDPTDTCEQDQPCGRCTLVGDRACEDDGGCDDGEACDGEVCRTSCAGDPTACAAPLRCEAGVCTDRCGGDADCTDDQICAGGHCVDAFQCQDRSDCPPSQICVRGHCDNGVGQECSGPEDCPQDYHCVPECPASNPRCDDGPLKCQQMPTPCRFWYDCGPRQTCEEGVCRDAVNPGETPCRSSAECPATQYCLNGVCSDGTTGRICSDDWDCDLGGARPQICDNGVCVDNPGDSRSCSRHADCEWDELCDFDRKVCAPNRGGGYVCDASRPCPGTATCQDGVCVYPDGTTVPGPGETNPQDPFQTPGGSGCSSDGDCDAVCGDGKCYCFDRQCIPRVDVENDLPGCDAFPSSCIYELLGCYERDDPRWCQGEYFLVSRDMMYWGEVGQNLHSFRVRKIFGTVTWQFFDEWFFCYQVNRRARNINGDMYDVYDVQSFTQDFQMGMRERPDAQGRTASYVTCGGYEPEIYGVDLRECQEYKDVFELPPDNPPSSWNDLPCFSVLGSVLNFIGVPFECHCRLMGTDCDKTYDCAGNSLCCRRDEGPDTCGMWYDCPLSVFRWPF